MSVATEQVGDPYGYGIGVFPRHQEMLHASAISVDVARARGYVSVDTYAQVSRFGFGAACPVPGLLIPYCDYKGEKHWQYRPDNPRTDENGKIVKYENPKEIKVRLDVCPSILGDLKDASIDLVITEGCKKVDAALSAGFCCIGLPGVGVWAVGRETDEGDHVTRRIPLPDWKAITLKERTVYICFDSDCFEKSEVYDQMKKLARWLSQQGANVRVVRLPSDGAKVGLDDFLGAGGDPGYLETEDAWREHVLPALPAPEKISVPAFPVKAFPRLLQSIAWQVQGDLGCEMDFVCGVMLQTCGAAIGNLVTLRAGPTWVESPNLWLVLVGDPGTKKTPVFNALRPPLEQIDDQLRSVSASRRADAVKNKKDELPPESRLIVNSVSVEKLLVFSGDNPRGMTAFQDEIKTFLDEWGAYGRDSRGVYLSLWSGGTIAVDRIGRASSYSKNTRLSLTGGIQWDLLSAFTGGDGLWPRLLFAVGYVQDEYRSLPAPWDAKTTTYEDWGKVVHQLWGMGNTQRECSLSPEAWEVFDAYRQENFPRIKEDPYYAAPVLLKMETYVLRFGLGFHYMDAVCGEDSLGTLSGDQMERAVSVGQHYSEVSLAVSRNEDVSTNRDREENAKVESLRRFLREHPEATRTQVLRSGPRWLRVKGGAALLNEILELIGHELPK